MCSGRPMDRESILGFWSYLRRPSPTFADLRRVQNQKLRFGRDARPCRWFRDCPRSAPVPPVDFRRYCHRGCHHGRAPGRSSLILDSAKVGEGLVARQEVSSDPKSFCTSAVHSMPKHHADCPDAGGGLQGRCWSAALSSSQNFPELSESDL